MFGKSGKYLLLMTYWWILPFLVISLSGYSLVGHLRSYYPFFIALIITALLSLLCGRVEGKTGYWNRAGYWKKYFVLNGLYILNIFLILSVTLTLHSFGLIGYFGGDPEGSFGMLYIPSIIFYLLGGIILGAWKRFRRV
jgi:hypothetical protein